MLAAAKWSWRSSRGLRQAAGREQKPKNSQNHNQKQLKESDSGIAQVNRFCHLKIFGLSYFLLYIWKVNTIYTFIFRLGLPLQQKVTTWPTYSHHHHAQLLLCWSVRTLSKSPVLLDVECDLLSKTVIWGEHQQLCVSSNIIWHKPYLGLRLLSIITEWSGGEGEYKHGEQSRLCHFAYSEKNYSLFNFQSNNNFSLNTTFQTERVNHGSRVIKISTTWSDFY